MISLTYPFDGKELFETGKAAHGSLPELGENAIIKLGEKIAEQDARLNEVSERIFDIVASLPNLPDEDLLAGEKENNQVIYYTVRNTLTGEILNESFIRTLL